LLLTWRICNSLAIQWQGKKDSNLRMLESKSSALTGLAIPLHNLVFAAAADSAGCRVKPIRYINSIL
jgi:hypothetical protein